MPKCSSLASAIDAAATMATAAKTETRLIFGQRSVVRRSEAD